MSGVAERGARGEALADLDDAAPGRFARGPGRHRKQRERVRRKPVAPGLRDGAVLAIRGARLRAGAVAAALTEVMAARGRGLVMRILLTGAASATAFLAAGWSPGTAGVVAGALSWLLITGLRH